MTNLFGRLYGTNEQRTYMAGAMPQHFKTGFQSIVDGAAAVGACVTLLLLLFLLGLLELLELPLRLLGAKFGCFIESLEA